jgi:serine/threonine protein phosphatase PrpC
VTDERICEIITEQAGDLQEAARLLVKESNEAGGDDNVTVVIVGID